jgi:tetratricopeptide (TPR) repeat protein
MENEQLGRRSPVWKVGDLINQESEVRAILGEGGMGTVYKVFYRPWSRELAVKCPRPEIFARADGKERFIQEAETWTALGTYPHIVEGLFVRVTNDIPHVFAEYVSGGSLADWIEQHRLYGGGRNAALSRILDISIQFAWGLHFAHERGLVHQDVKPANVMMTADGTAKVTDFGLARARQLAGESPLAVGSGNQSLLVSSRGMTPAYCSPEQAAGRPLSRKTDIWSWGLSVLEMFMGEVSWRVGVVAEAVLASYKAENPALPEMPAELIAVLKQCFQQEPAARPATMVDVATELETIYAHCVGRPYPRVMPKSTEMQVPQLLNQGVSLRDLGRSEEALVAYEEALRLDSNNAQAHGGRGDTLAQLGRREEALAAYEEALRLAPSYAAVHLNRGNVLRELGRREEALAAYEEALRLGVNDTDAAVHLNRGNVLRELGRREEALAAYEEALRLDPNFTAAHIGRGNVLRELGRPEGRLAAYERELRLDPSDAPAYLSLGMALGQLGRREEALAAYEHVLRLDPNDAQAHTGRGLMLLQLGQGEEALAAFAQALRLDPNLAQAHHFKGMALGQMGRSKEALAAIEQALRLSPNDAQIYRSLALVLRDLGRPEESARALQKARALQSHR